MPQGTATAPAPPPDIFIPRVTEFCISGILCQILRKDTSFQEIEFRCQQIDDVRAIAEREHNIPISFNALARAFECPRNRVESVLAHPLESPGQRGKQMALVNIVNNSFWIGFNQMPKKAHPLTTKKSKITA
jgi:hypothetical protein